MSDARHLEGFEAPLHRALVEPILLAGVPRAIAIMIGTASAAIGLGLQQWLAGILRWAVAHTAAVFAAKHVPDFAAVLLRHIRQKGTWSC